MGGRGVEPDQVPLRSGVSTSVVCWLIGYLGITNTVAELKAFERKPKPRVRHYGTEEPHRELVRPQCFSPPFQRFS